MTILYFGDYDPDYSRNRILIKGLKKNNVEILECNDNSQNFFVKLINLYKKHKKIKTEYDLIIVGYSPISRSMVPFARLLSQKKIVWDAFYSLYDAWVFDKKLVSKYHPKAWYYWFCDLLNCVLADKILLDTNEHIDYFVKTFGVKKDKFIRVFVGSDDTVMYPRKKAENPVFTIHFHGHYIPLQGTEYIIRAAKILENENILFRMTGSRGQEYKKALNLASDLKLNNIKFLDSVSYSGLADLIVDCDLCLGIFGNTEKAQRVIPNKVYEAIATARPVISADTPAMRELFNDRENILMCESANPESLAERILELKNDGGLREKIAREAWKLFNRYCRPEIIGEKLLTDLGLKNIEF